MFMSVELLFLSDSGQRLLRTESRRPHYSGLPPVAQGHWGSPEWAGPLGRKWGVPLMGSTCRRRVKRWEHLLAYHVKYLLKEKCIAKSSPMTLVSSSCLTNLCKGNGQSCLYYKSNTCPIEPEKHLFNYGDKTPTFKTILYFK